MPNRYGGGRNCIENGSFRRCAALVCSVSGDCLFDGPISGASSLGPGLECVLMNQRCLRDREAGVTGVEVADLRRRRERRMASMSSSTGPLLVR